MSPPVQRRPLPPTVLLVCLLLQVALHLAWPGPRLLSFPLILAGLAPLLAGLLLNLAADSALKKAVTTVKPFQESTALVTGGPFARSRHPMYLGMVLALVGVAMLLGSGTPFLLVPLFGWVAHRAYIRVEERMLAERFGTAWQTYKATVRPWI
jgi:protein-S-isoprenylcysteine O-methyltransferase Ste14